MKQNNEQNIIPSNDLQRLEQRLDLMERKIQSLQIQRATIVSLLGLALLGFGAKSALTQNSSPTSTKSATDIVCRSITVIGKDGKKRVGIGVGDYDAGAIRLTTSDGKTTALLGSDDKRGGSLALWDSQQSQRDSIGQEINLTGPKFTGGLTLGNSANGGYIHLYGQKKGQQQRGLFPIWSAAANEDGGLMSISTHSSSIQPSPLRILANVTKTGGQVQTFKYPEILGAEAQLTGSLPVK